MDKNLLKIRLKTFFTYDLLKVLAICFAFCVVFTFVYGVVEKKPTEGQRFAILYADYIILGDESYDLIAYLYNDENENAFSYDILVIEPKQIVVGNNSAQYMMITYSDLCDDDIFMCTETLISTYVETGRAQDLDLYIENAFKYLYDNNFYSTNGVINEDAIIKNFINKYGSDSRFRESKYLELAKQKEVERIKNIFNNATLLKEVFKNNPQIFDDKHTTIESLDYTGRFAIDLGKLSGGEKHISNAFSRKVVNEETKEVSYTANGVYLLLGNKQNKNGDLHFEGLNYLVNMLKMYSNII